MKLWLLLFVANVDYFASSTDPKDEVEILPEAIEAERSKVRLFWAIMHEVCRTFCAWKRFCNKFCELFNPEEEPNFDIDFFKSSKNSRQTLWLYDSASKICQDDYNCVQNCLKMELDEYTPTISSKETTENVFKSLFEIARKYFTKCAQMNSKPLENVELITVHGFCREVTSGWNQYERTCVNSLT